MFIDRRHQFRYIAITSVGVGTGLCVLFTRNLGRRGDVEEKINKSSTLFKDYFSKSLVRWCAKYSRHQIFHKAGIPKFLISLSNSNIYYLHNVGVKALAVVRFDSSSTVQDLKSRCEPHTLVSLARTPGAHPGWFMVGDLQQGHYAPDVYDELENSVLKLLQILYDKTSDTCTLWMIEQALKPESDVSIREPEHRKIFWSFGEDTLLDDQPRKISTEDRWIYYLSCLKHATCCMVDCDTLLRSNVLKILKETIKAFIDSQVVLALCGDIIANVSLIRDARNLVVDAGFIEISKYLSNSSSSIVSSAGKRALHNLDVFDAFQCHLLDGVHQVYPVGKAEPSKIELDIVFVHGLAGGPFFTWRQQKHNKNLYYNKKSDCWPKDWLAKDVPHSRILCVEYSTHMTNWTVTCPYTDETHSLAARGKELSNKLLRAGVGSRPILWITHSMGGLIVKDILTKSGEEHEEGNPLLHNTHGIVFYSVPHRGSPLAKQVSHAKYITFPSVEVTDLKQDSPKLMELHDNFMKLVYDRGIKVLSFFETLPIELPLVKIKVQIVPTWSAEVGVGKKFETNENHVFVCKPKTKDDTSYRELLKFVQRSVLECRQAQLANNKALPLQG